MGEQRFNRLQDRFINQFVDDYENSLKKKKTKPKLVGKKKIDVPVHKKTPTFGRTKPSTFGKQGAEKKRLGFEKKKPSFGKKKPSFGKKKKIEIRKKVKPAFGKKQKLAIRKKV